MIFVCFDVVHEIYALVDKLYVVEIADRVVRN